MHTPFDQVKVTIVSPDKSIRITYSPADGVRLAGRPDAVRQHTDDSLSDQIQHALTGLLTGFRSAKNKVLHQVRQDAGADPGVPPSKVAAQRRELTDLRLSALILSGHSPGGRVTVGLHAAKGLRVKLKPGTVAALKDEVISEVEAAVRAVLADYRQQVAAVHKQVYVDLSPSKLEGEIHGNRQHRSGEEHRGKIVPRTGR